MADDRFIKLRAGILEHIELQLMSMGDFAVFVFLLLKADYKTGVCISSAPAISAAFSKCKIDKLSLAMAKRHLHRLEARGYIRRKLRSHGNYPIIIPRFFPDHNLQRMLPLWELMPDRVSPKHDPTGDPTGDPIQELRIKKEEKNSAAKHAAPSPALPSWISREAWDGWLDMRRLKRVPWTARAERLAINKLAQLRALGHDPAAVLEQSTLCGWAGLFALKGSDIQPAAKTEVRAGAGPEGGRIKPEVLQRLQRRQV